VRYGLIGCGGIGELRAQALAQYASGQLVAVSDLDEDLCKRFAADHGATPVKEWKDLLEMETVDAIIVSTPPSVHAEMCISALESGKHVLCEKPLARTPEECQEIVTATNRSEKFLATGFNYRFYPSIKKARELLDSGIIGELDHIRSYTGYSAADHDHDWLHDSTVMGGGSLRDNGIHLIDLTCYFLGPVKETIGFASNDIWKYNGCEDNGFALIKNHDGKIASLQSSWTEWRGYRLSIDIYGSLGCIRTSCFPMYTQVTWMDERGGPTKKKFDLFPKNQIMEKLKTYRWVVVQSFIEEFQAFENQAVGFASPIATAEDGLQTINVAFDACRNLKT